MATINFVHGSLHGLMLLKRDRVDVKHVEYDVTGEALLSYTHDRFNHLLAAAAKHSDVRFVVDVLSVEEDIIAVLEAADWELNTHDMCYHNPKWNERKYQLQVVTDQQIGYIHVTDKQIENMLLEGSTKLRRILNPTTEMVSKYQLEATSVNGVWDF